MNIGDIVERDPDNSKPPSAPKAPSKSVFSSKKQWKSKKESRFKQATNQTIGEPTPSQDAPKQSELPEKLSEAEKIHLESVKKLSTMSPEEIAKEQEQLFSQFDPNVLKSLLRRAEIKEDQMSGITSSLHDGESKNDAGAVANTENPVKAPESAPHHATVADDDSFYQNPEERDLFNPKDIAEEEQSTDSPLPSTSIHFPQVPQDLKKYFPDLPEETDKLAWMQPIGADEEAEYSEEMTSVGPSELRFDFNGNLITPRLSRYVPVEAGLHHHGDAPSAAGYTIPELSHLARSTVPSQRGMAIQTVGRVLHKFKQGKFNKSSDLQFGLDQLIKQTRIMDTLYEAASDKTRSLTVKTLATEALWLIESGK